MEHTMTRERKILLFVAVSLLVTTLGLLAYGRISQPTDYHHFADVRTIWGIPNFFNVTTNIFFLMAGYAGLFVFGGLSRAKLPADGRAALLVFAIGCVGTAAGSAFYHAFPSSASLVWDRLPMTICFAAIFAEFVAMHISARGARIVLPIVAIFGIASVWYWQWTTQLGADDLRPYVLMQFFPIFIIPTTALLFPRKEGWSRNWTLTILWYGGAKVFEYFDESLYQLSGELLSGHSLKHIAAGIACLYAVTALRERRIGNQK